MWITLGRPGTWPQNFHQKEYAGENACEHRILIPIQLFVMEIWAMFLVFSVFLIILEQYWLFFVRFFLRTNEWNTMLALRNYL